MANKGLKKPHTKKTGTVRKIIPAVVPSESEKAEIEVHDADHLYKEIRIENTLQDSKGKKMKFKKGADVELTIETDEKDTTPKE